MSLLMYGRSDNMFNQSATSTSTRAHSRQTRKLRSAVVSSFSSLAQCLCFNSLQAQIDIFCPNPPPQVLTPVKPTVRYPGAPSRPGPAPYKPLSPKEVRPKKGTSRTAPRAGSDGMRSTALAVGPSSSATGDATTWRLNSKRVLFFVVACVRACSSEVYCGVL